MSKGNLNKLYYSQEPFNKKISKMNLVVAIDDLHPEQGWGCEGDVQVDYLIVK